MYSQYHLNRLTDRLSLQVQQPAYPCHSSAPDQQKSKEVRWCRWCLKCPYHLVSLCPSTYLARHSLFSTTNHQPVLPIVRGWVVPIRTLRELFFALISPVHHPFVCISRGQLRYQKERDNSRISGSPSPTQRRFLRLVPQSYNLQYSQHRSKEPHPNRYLALIHDYEHSQLKPSYRLGTSQDQV